MIEQICVLDLYKIPSKEIRLNRKVFYGLQKERDELIKIWFDRVQSRINYCEFAKLTEILLIDKFFCELGVDEITSFQGTAPWSLQQLNEYFNGQNVSTGHVNSNDDSVDQYQLSPTESIENESSSEIEDEHPSQTNTSFEIVNENTSIVKDLIKCKLVDNETYDPTEFGERSIDSSAPKNNSHTSSGKKSNKLNLKKARPEIASHRQPYSCDLCGKSYAFKRSISIHMKKAHPTGRHSCKSCVESFATIYELDIHSKIHNFTCEICGRNFITLLGIRSHITSKHVKKIAPPNVEFKCKSCDESFATIDERDIHSKTHDFTCDICGQNFATLTRIKNHMNWKHIKKFSCDLCDKSFGAKRSLKWHVEGFHLGLSACICNVCGLTLKNIYYLKEHLNQHDENKKRYECDLCNKSFKHHSTLMKHKKVIHQGDSRHSCKICNKCFLTKNNLAKHVLIHSEEFAHSCKFCDRSFQRLDHLKFHTKTVHLDIRPHSCTLCSKRFTVPYYLKQHMNVHAGKTKGFACDMCDKAYSQLRNLKVHKKTAHQK